MACWAFSGSFRIGELLEDKENTFNPTTVLMNSDIKLTKIEVNGDMTELLMIKLKNPKESWGASGFVEMFANKSPWCPLKAHKSWQKGCKLERRLKGSIPE